jgi:hypothetical protein
MNTPTRTVKRTTALPHRGRQIVLIVPPCCDYVTLRQKGTRRSYDIALAAVYDLAVRQQVARDKSVKKVKGSGK